MNSEIHVDVIVLSWNRVEDTIAAIASALAQEGIEKRILVVDQGSDAANLEQLERYVARFDCIELKKLGRNVGVAGGRNIASAMGNAPYIVALDSDAEFADTDMLARAVTIMNNDPHLCAIGFRINNFFTGENDATSWDYPAPGSHPDRKFFTTRFIGAGHAIRRSAFELAGGYDERLFFCGEEIDLCYRMLNTGLRIQYVPSVIVCHKVSPEHRVLW
ncbi:MAG TPA: glycosyltransferase, partial [Rhodocyclaceae bacterium]|nr:glycosyltransferase [Rhodocyclaceae bacterium]